MIYLIAALLLACVSGDKTITCGSCEWTITGDGVFQRTVGGDCSCSGYYTAMMGNGEMPDRIKTIVNPATVFEGMSLVRELVLMQNRITVLDEELFQPFVQYQKLTDISLQNQFGGPVSFAGPGVFRGLTSLRAIVMGQNYIAEVPAGLFDGLVNLRTLYFHDNPYTYLHPDLFATNTALNEIYLGNKLTCKVDFASGATVENGYPANYDSLPACTPPPTEAPTDSCNTYMTRVDCNADDRCDWFRKACDVKPTGCAANRRVGTCRLASGCTWNSGCTEATGCGDYTRKGWCNSVSGCFFSGGVCGDFACAKLNPGQCRRHADCTYLNAECVESSTLSCSDYTGGKMCNDAGCTWTGGQVQECRD